MQRLKQNFGVEVGGALFICSIMLVFLYVLRTLKKHFKPYAYTTVLAPITVIILYTKPHKTNRFFQCFCIQFLKQNFGVETMYYLLVMLYWCILICSHILLHLMKSVKNIHQRDFHRGFWSPECSSYF